jgi:hypothetical protein
MELFRRVVLSGRSEEEKPSTVHRAKYASSTRQYITQHELIRILEFASELCLEEV